MGEGTPDFTVALALERTLRLLISAAIVASLSTPLLSQGSLVTATGSPAAEQAPRDVRYPGTLTLHVDATDTQRGILRVRQTIPVVRPGPLLMRYPQWLPGNHAPSGPIEAVAGFRFTAQGRPLTWHRDPRDVFAFIVDVPAGALAIDVSFDYFSNAEGAINRVEMTPDLLNLQWEKVSLYPAGHYVRQIMIQPSVTLPAGFTGVAALDGERRSGNRINYAVTSYETLVDSPMFAGRHYRRWELGNDVGLNVFADRPEDLAATADQIVAHRRLVDQTFKTFGTKPFDRYEFLLGLSSELSGIGLEHHRSSENIVPRNYFTDWANTGSTRGLLPHEFTHSWNGKFRRPLGTWTPDYDVLMQNELLWVYEGQTSFWDIVLGARSGMVPKDVALGEIASSAAYYSIQAGRQWRPLADTTNNPVIGYGRSVLYPSYQRASDYYSESALLWIDVDTLVRQRTGGRRSLDDFARVFFGIRAPSQTVLTYTFDDVVTVLNRIAPYDWASFLRDRVYRTAPPPLAGIERGGYRLVWKDEPNAYDASAMKRGQSLNLSYSLGFTIGSGAKISNVIWDGPAHALGITPGSSIVAVNGREYSDDELKLAVKGATGGREPVRLLLKEGPRFREIALPYHQGLRFPHLERIPGTASTLNRMLEPLR